MDIYKYAEDINYGADYYEMQTGQIYKIQDYGKELKENPDARIAVTDTQGNLLGYVKKKSQYIGRKLHETAHINNTQERRVY